MTTALDKHSRVLMNTFKTRGKYGYILHEGEAAALIEKFEEVDLFLESDKEIKFSKINYDKIPVDYMRLSVQNYIKYGDLPGACLYALLSGDYFNLYRYANEENWKNLRKWAKWFKSEVPVKCYGSDIRIAAWCDRQRTILESFCIRVEDIYNLQRFYDHERLKRPKSLRLESSRATML